MRYFENGFSPLLSLAGALVVGLGLFAATPAAAGDIGGPAPSLVQSARTALYAGDIDRGIELSEKALNKKLPAEERRLAVNNLCVGHAVKDEIKQAREYCDQAMGKPSLAWRFYNSRARVKSVKRAFEDLTVK
ncbi:MAG: hypothetical protein ACE5EM_08840 [Sphingomonadales bacterium]